MMGTIMMPTTRPAMKSEALTCGVATLKIGIHDRWRDIQPLMPTTFGCSS